jgi:hypothetical protein
VLEGLDQTERARAHEVIELDVAGASSRELLRHMVHEAKMLAQDGVASSRVDVRACAIEGAGHRLRLLRGAGLVVVTNAHRRRRRTELIAVRLEATDVPGCRHCAAR